MLIRCVTFPLPMRTDYLMTEMTFILRPSDGNLSTSGLLREMAQEYPTTLESTSDQVDNQSEVGLRLVFSSAFC